MDVPPHGKMASLLPGLTSLVPQQHRRELDLVIDATGDVENVVDHRGS